MKRKMILISVLALLMLFAAVPVMAEPTKGQKVTAKLIMIPPPTPGDPGHSWFTESGVFHGKGRTETYSAILLLDGPPPEKYSVFFVSVEHGNWNPQTRTLVMDNYDVLYIPKDGSPDGFSGNSKLTLYDWSFVTSTSTSMTVHSVYQGFGSFADQTLMLSYDSTTGGPITGYCLKG